MQAQLSQLQSLYLQNSDKSQPNPVCSRPEYKSVVLTSLTHLRNLDGERRPSCRDANEVAFKADCSLPNISKLSSNEVDISRFLPPEWEAWLAEDADVGTQEAHSDLHQAGAATSKVLDECNVLSGVLKDELAKTDRLLKQ
ncbi:TPA: Leucine-rich repeat-containing protein 56 [Trebouxia sp. C0005]